MAITQQMTRWHSDGAAGNDDNGGGFGYLSSNFTTMFTDGAATNANTVAPVFTSASYTFVASDVGHWLFIKSGTNWLPGFYEIVSVSAGAATLEGTIGRVEIGLAQTATPSTLFTNLTAGCSTTASPTGATWHIDYSRSAASRFTYTDLVIDAVTNTKLTSAAYPFTQAVVGNIINITGGTGFTVGRYQVMSVAAGVATMSGAIGTTSSTGGTGKLGGALASPGIATYWAYRGNMVFVAGNQTYLLTSNTAGAVGSVLYLGDTNIYQISIKGFVSKYARMDNITYAEMPILKASGITSTQLVGKHSIAGRHDCHVRFVKIDGDNQTGIVGIGRGATGSNSLYDMNCCAIVNCPGGATVNPSSLAAAYCFVYNCGTTSVAAFSVTTAFRCLCLYSPGHGISAYSAVECISAYGGTSTTAGIVASACNCVVHDRAGYGIQGSMIFNNIVIRCAGYGYAGTAFVQSVGDNNYDYGNGSYYTTTSGLAGHQLKSVTTSGEILKAIDSTPPYTNSDWAPKDILAYYKSSVAPYNDWLEYFGYGATDNVPAHVGAIPLSMANVNPGMRGGFNG